jgi:HEAT repeat protein
LGSIKVNTTSVIPALVEVLTDKDLQVRMQAVRALGAFGPGAKAAVPALIKILDDRTSQGKGSLTVGEMAMRGLCEIGRDAKSAIPVLLTMLNDKDSSIRSEAALTLGYLSEGEAEVVTALTRVLRDKEDTGVKAGAALALGRIGPKAKSAVPSLVEVLKGVDSQKANVAVHLRDCILRGLEGIGVEAQRAIPVVVELLQDKKAGSLVRSQAVRTLAKIGPQSEVALQSIKAALTDEDSAVSDAARRVLMNRKPEK